MIRGTGKIARVGLLTRKGDWMSWKVASIIRAREEKTEGKKRPPLESASARKDPTEEELLMIKGGGGFRKGRGLYINGTDAHLKRMLGRQKKDAWG